MAETDTTGDHYLRTLGKNGRCRQVILPAALMRTPLYREAKRVVITPHPDGTLTLQTLEMWMHHNQPKEPDK